MYYFRDTVSDGKIPLGDDLTIATEQLGRLLQRESRRKKLPEGLETFGTKHKWPDEILENAIPYEPKCGIYFLIFNQSIVYVGQSVDLWQRIQQHRAKKEIAFDSVSWVHCEARNLNAVEKHYIDTLKPKHNKRHTPFMRDCERVDKTNKLPLFKSMS